MQPAWIWVSAKGRSNAVQTAVIMSSVPAGRSDEDVECCFSAVFAFADLAVTVSVPVLGDFSFNFDAELIMPPVASTVLGGSLVLRLPPLTAPTPLAPPDLVVAPPLAAFLVLMDEGVFCALPALSASLCRGVLGVDVCLSAESR